MIDPVDLAAVRRGPSFAKIHPKDDSSTRLGTSILRGDKDLPGPNYYATRLSTVLLVRRTGEVLFIERDMWLLGTDGNPELASWDNCHERRFRFQLQCEASGCKHHIVPVSSVLTCIYPFACCRKPISEDHGRVGSTDNE